MSILELVKGSEFKIRVEHFKDFNKSFFKDIYVSAAKNVKDIITNTKKYHEPNQNEKFRKDNEEYNNIIAFAGERGTGKSSVMISFAQALDYIKESTEIPDGIQDFKHIKDVKYTLLDVIDPSLFECNESIFEVIIAKMFAKFKEHIDKSKNDIKFESRKDLLKIFQEVYQNLKVIHSGKNDLFRENAHSENILETLSMLASGSNMRQSFIKLVDKFLELFNEGRSKEGRLLVIPIDDLDMNIKHAADMVEQIRKYLLVPNVIILMAVKIDQLTDAIEQEYRNNFKVLLDKNKVTNPEDFPKVMAARYLEKLIPDGRKLFLPGIKVHKNAETTIVKFYEKKPDEDKEELCIEQKVLNMTYEKIGIPFIKPQYGIHYLVSDNLRELHNYLTMLDKMPAIRNEEGRADDTKYVQNNSNNLNIFENYFLNIWIKNNLSLTRTDAINEFIKADIKLKNKFIVTSINNLLNQRKEELIQLTYIRENITKYNNKPTIITDTIISEIVKELPIEESLFNDKKEFMRAISKKVSNPLNISLGDVLTILQLFIEFDDSEENRKFAFAIRTMYSIMLYRLINIEKRLIDIKIKNINSKLDDTMQITKDSEKELAKLIGEGDDNYNSVAILLGGNIFGDSAKKFIRPDKFRRRFNRCILTLPYNNILIKGKHIGDIFKEILDGKRTVEEMQIELNLIEWLHYFLYLGDEKTIFEDRKIAYEVDAKYIQFVGNRAISKATFNVTGFSFFVLNPKENLSRIYASSINRMIENKGTYNDNFRNMITSIMSQLEAKSLTNQIACWQENYNLAYPLVLPVYSLEVIENIILNIRDFVEKNNKDITEDSYYIYFKVLIEQMGEVMQTIYSNNKYLQIASSNNPDCDFVKVFKESPVISFIIQDSKSKSDSDSYHIYVTELLEQIYELATRETNLTENIITDLKSLKTELNYFNKSSEKVVTAQIIFTRVSKLINKFKSDNLDTLKLKLSVFLGDVSMLISNPEVDTDSSRRNLCTTLMEMLDNAIDRINSTLSDIELENEDNG